MKSKNLASIWKRVLATLIDYGLFYLCFYVYALYFGREIETGYEVNGLQVFPILIFWFFYFPFVEGIWQGTIGHQILNLKVITEDFDEVDIGHSLKRRIIDIIDFSLIGIPALITANNNSKKQRIGDMFAKTIVVEVEQPVDNM